MAKRRLVSHAAEAEASQKKQQKLDETEAKQEPQPQEEEVEEQQPDPAIVEELIPVKEEDKVNEEVQEEVEEEEEEDQDADANGDGDGDGNGDGDGDGDEDPISDLLEPFTKDQLIGLLNEAAEHHPDVASQIRKIANEDTVHRKIFVHGLGWDATADTLRAAFSEFGEIDDCKVVTDKASGKSKGYGFILFKSRAGARRALQQPQKKIGNRMTACQLAATGPVPGSTSSSVLQSAQAVQASEYTQRKIYVSNVSADLDPQKLTDFFAKFGEIEEGPLGLDKHTGKPKGFCLYVYKSVESAKRALEEPHKHFDGNVLHCQRAIDGPKTSKQVGSQQQRGQKTQKYGRNDNRNLAGAQGTGGGLMVQSAGGAPYNHGGPPQAINPALGQALTALLASQGGGLGLNTLLGSLGAAGMGTPGSAHGMQVGYGSPGVPGGAMNQAGLGGYGAQSGYPGAYPNQQGQGGGGRPQYQYGHMGGMAPYGSQ